MIQENFRLFNSLLNTKRLIRRFEAPVAPDTAQTTERLAGPAPHNADQPALETQQLGGAAIKSAQFAANRLPRLNLTEAEGSQLAAGLQAVEAKGAAIRAEMKAPKPPNFLDRWLARRGYQKAQEAIARYEEQQQQRANRIAAENLRIRPTEPPPAPIQIEFAAGPFPNAPRIETVVGPNGELTLQAAPLPEPAEAVKVATKEVARPTIKRVEGAEKLDSQQYLTALLADPKSVERRAELTRNYLKAKGLSWQEAGLDLPGLDPKTAIDDIDAATLVQAVVALQVKENLPQADNTTGQDAILGDNTYKTALALNLAPQKRVEVAAL